MFDSNSKQKSKKTLHQVIRYIKRRRQIISSNEHPQLLETNDETAIPFQPTCENLKFVGRDGEVNTIIHTLHKNSKSDLSNAKLVSLFQMYGIGKTTLITKLRDVYGLRHGAKAWEGKEWIRDMVLLPVDCRELRHFNALESISSYFSRFLCKVHKNEILGRTEKNDGKYAKRQLVYERMTEMSNFCDLMDFFTTAFEGYLIFFDEIVDDKVTDSDWCPTNDPLCILKRYDNFTSMLLPILTSNKSAVIIGHIPFQLSMKTRIGTNHSFQWNVTFESIEETRTDRCGTIHQNIYGIHWNSSKNEAQRLIHHFGKWLIIV